MDGWNHYDVGGWCGDWFGYRRSRQWVSRRRSGQHRRKESTQYRPDSRSGQNRGRDVSRYKRRKRSDHHRYAQDRTGNSIEISGRCIDRDDHRGQSRWKRVDGSKRRLYRIVRNRGTDRVVWFCEGRFKRQLDRYLRCQICENDHSAVRRDCDPGDRDMRAIGRQSGIYGSRREYAGSWCVDCRL